MAKIGLIGYGGLGQIHARCYKQIHNAKVTHIADSSEKRLAQAKESERCEGFFQDYKELLEIKDLDLIDICTQSALNPQLCMDAAKNGKSFLVEPPFAVTVQQVKEISDLIRNNGVKANISFPYRFKPSIYPFIMKHMHGEFGKVFSIYTNEFEPSPKLNPKVPPIFKQPRTVDALAFFGGNAKSVTAKAPTIFDDPTNLLEPEIRAFIEFENGCTGFLDWSAYSPVFDFTIQVYGAGFAVRMNSSTLNNQVLNWWWQPKPRLSAFRKTVSGLRSFFSKYDYLTETGYMPMMTNILKNIETYAKPLIPFDDGLKSIAIIEAIHKSIKEGHEVKVESQ